MTAVEGLRVGVYEHHRGDHYLVLGIARWHSHDERAGQLLVVYVRLYGHHEGGPPMSVRPLQDFIGTTDIEGVAVPTFRYIGPIDPPA